LTFAIAFVENTRIALISSLKSSLHHPNTAGRFAEYGIGPILQTLALNLR
jgi:hypothetical protein